MKASCVVVLVLVSSLLLVTLAAAGAPSSSPPSSVGMHPALVLGRKGRELGQSSGYHYYQHQSKHMQMLQPQEVPMEVKEHEEENGKVRWTADQGEDAEAGMIYGADYSSVAMHAGSPPTAKPKHRHPKP